MRKIKSILLIVLSVLMLTSLSLFVACHPKEGENSSSTAGKTEYTVTFNTNGGNSIASQKVASGSTITLPEPTKAGYVFDGWYTDSALNNAVSSNTYVVTANVTFYAKWAEGIVVTLDPNGGTIDKTTVAVKVGAKISDALKNLVPQRAHYEFDAWLENGSVLSSSRVAQKGQNISLVARYKVEISVQIYEQNLEQNGYNLAETVAQFALEGTSFKYSATRTGFKMVDNADAVLELTVDADYSKNVLKAYYDRNTSQTSFHSNYPVKDMENITETVEALYGATIDAVDYYTCDGYLLIGYSKTPNGEVLYPVNAYKKNLYNADAGDVAETKVTVETNQVLYAVWAKGYIDMFGGADSIFYFEDGTDEVYLSRGGVFFKGNYLEGGMFEFYDKDDNLLLTGKLFENNTFCYQDLARGDGQKLLFVQGAGIDNTVRLKLDSYNGATLYYTDAAGEVIRNVKGYYLYDEENGDYVGTFEDGQSFHFLDGYSRDKTNALVSVFQIRNEEELELGVLYRGLVYDGTLTYYTSAYQAILNGYGQVYVFTGSGFYAYYYTRSNDIITFINASTLGTAGIYRIIDINGEKCYIEYNASLDREVYVRPNEDVTLKMDGAGSATYKNGSTVLNGVYTAVASTVYDGNYLITFYTSEGVMKFVTGIETYEVEAPDKDEEDNDTTAQRAIVNQKDPGYAEYSYTDDEGVWKMPIIAMNEPYNGKASIYLFSSKTGLHELAMVGSYTYDNTTGRYTFTVEDYIETGLEVEILPIEFKNIKSFVFGIDNATISSYNISYWYAITDNEDETTDCTVVYESTTDNSTITVISDGVAIYEYNSNVYYTYLVTDEDTGVSRLITAQGTLLTLELNEEEKSFTKYLYAPRDVYLVNSEGMYSKNTYLALDGKGGAVLTYITYNEEKVKSVEEHPGTYTETEEKTFLGAPISVFTADDGSTTLRVIVVVSGNDYVAFVEDDTYKTEYRSDAGILTLDGFYYLAEFTTSTGYTYQGTYYMTGENELVFGVIYNGQLIGYFYMDLTEDGFTVKGSEYGEYIVYDNSMAVGMYVSLDGYGNAKVFTFEEVTDEETGAVTNERKYIDENATYVIENGEVVITYLLEGVENKYIGTLGTLTSGNYTYRLFIILHKEVTFTYVNGNEWFVMTVNEIGNATLYGKTGVIQTGSVTIINDYLFYFVNSTGTDACVYKYDATTGYIEQLVYKNPFAYYTQDLQSLLFTQYGFAVFNNETRYFYERVDNTVYVYHYDAENPDANEYGYVKEEFGSFTDVKEWDGEIYYKNDGYPISFNRKEDNADKYPLPAGLVSEKKETLENLIFQPTGSDTFAVSGSVSIAGKAYQCTVVRELDDDGEYVIFVAITGTNLRYYISIDYTGVREDGTGDNYYEILSCTEEISALSSTYLTNYLWGLMLAGVEIPNVWGYINTVTVYNEAGDPDINQFTAEFLSNSGVNDTNDELPTFDKHDFKWYTSNIVLVEYEGTDGDVYRLYLYLGVNQFFGVNEYTIVAFTRVQTLTTDNYTVEAERLLFSEAGYAAGQLFGLKLFDSEGSEIELEEIYLKDGVVYALERTRDEDTNKITSSKLYTINLSEAEEDVVDDDTDMPNEGEEEKEQEKLKPSSAVKPYEKAEVEVETLTIYYDDSDGSKGYGWVEMSETKGIVTFVYNEYTDYYFMPDVTYDEDTDTYTFVDPDGVIFTLKIVEGVAVFDYTLASD